MRQREVEGRRLSGGSNERRKWARAEEVGIRPRVEAIHLSGGDGIPCRAAEEAGEEGGGPLGVGEVELGGGDEPAREATSWCGRRRRPAGVGEVELGGGDEPAREDSGGACR